MCHMSSLNAHWTHNQCMMTCHRDWQSNNLKYDTLINDTIECIRSGKIPSFNEAARQTTRVCEWEIGTNYRTLLMQYPHYNQPIYMYHGQYFYTIWVMHILIFTFLQSLPIIFSTTILDDVVIIVTLYTIFTSRYCVLYIWFNTLYSLWSSRYLEEAVLQPNWLLASICCSGVWVESQLWYVFIFYFLIIVYCPLWHTVW